MKVTPLWLTSSTDKLKELIAEHPDYPIVFCAGIEANTGTYPSVYCSEIRFEIKEILDAETPYDDQCVETDRSCFEEQMEEWIRTENILEEKNMSEEEIQAKLREAIAEYEPYWKDVIAICVDN